MTHMTIIHWLAILILFITLILSIFIIFRSYMEDKKSVYQFSLVSLIIHLLLMVASIYILDGYLKHAKLSKFKNKRVLRNETMLLTGIIKNTGKFKIGKVILHLRMVNGALSYKKMSITNASSSSSSFFGTTKDNSKKIVFEKDFVILKNLNPGRSKNFRAVFRYPPHFSRPSMKTKLYLH